MKTLKPELSRHDELILAGFKRGHYHAVLFGEDRYSIADRFQPTNQDAFNVLRILDRLIGLGHLPPTLLQVALAQAAPSDALQLAMYCEYILTWLTGRAGYQFLLLDAEQAYERVHDLSSRYPVVEMLHRAMADGDGSARSGAGHDPAVANDNDNDKPPSQPQTSSAGPPPLDDRDICCLVLVLCFSAAPKGVPKQDLSAAMRDLGVAAELYERELALLKALQAVRTTRSRVVFAESGTKVLADCDDVALKRKLAAWGIDPAALDQIFDAWQAFNGEDWEFG